MKDFENIDSGYSDNFIDLLHKKYLERLAFYEIQDKDLSRFSWSNNKHVNLYIIKYYYDFFDSYSNLIVATPAQNKDNLFYLDLSTETRNYTFSKLELPLEILSWLISENYLDLDVNQIIISSVSQTSGDFYYKNNTQILRFTKAISKDWVDNEYKSTLKKLSEPTIVEELPRTNRQFFIDRYHFDKMLKAINSSQFTDEFNQCLYAYEHEKWFLCAAGLGSCLEHLMLIILKNYNDKGYKTLKGLPKNPTAHNYIIQFRQPPISISSRQETFFNILFMARNAVDHHNTGKTQKELCDLLLDGISDLYNDYYNSSILIKENIEKD